MTKSNFTMVSNPEFLRAGSAVSDFLNPDRIVLGSEDERSAEDVALLYRSFNCPIIITDLRTAEMIKYASNAFLATRISFINEIASMCDQLGADVTEVARGMGLDGRIGAGFLNAGDRLGGKLFSKRRARIGAHGGGERVPPATVAGGRGDQPRHAPFHSQASARRTGGTSRADHRDAGALFQAEYR